MKNKKIANYKCSNCGARYIAWQGQCQNCGEWNTIVYEENQYNLTPAHLEISSIQIKRNDNYRELIKTSLDSFNNLLGGGIHTDQIILIGGEPGIGKSTLMLQMIKNIQYPTLYISGEESADQIIHRALRIGTEENYLNLLIDNRSDIQNILSNIESKKFKLVIIDSVQTITDENLPYQSQSTNNIRLFVEKIVEYAKKYGVSIILIGQITKDGLLAGPKLLEHMVDTVIYFEGDKYNDFRILKITKNRFGPSNEIAIYEMTESGLKDIDDIDSFFSSGDSTSEGVALTVYSEGSKVFLLEIQALCTKASYNFPKRVANGIEQKRLEMLIAIMDKKLKLNMERFDVFVNVVGDIKIEDRSTDLAVVAAIFSSIKNRPLPEKSCFIGEVSLTGSIRKVNNHEKRIKKAKKMNLSKIFDFQTYPNITNFATLFD
ncbi:MAG: DNA repair protein RadA [Candidatus Dojkabacteria bacterium]|nr:DNA repair protein RadA [Candidatus Dojkabacteria bacterium]